MTTRRQLLVSALAPVALAGCPQFNSAVNAVPGLAADADLIAKAVALVLPTIEKLTGLAGGAKNEVVKLVGEVEAAAAQIASSAGAETTVIVQTIGSAISGIAGRVLDLPGLPTLVATAIGAAQALWPALAAAVGIAPAASRLAVDMTPGQARGVLQALVGPARP